MRMESTRDACKEDVLKRLNRIEGQVKGIHRMVEEDKGCVEVLTQIAAVKAAINKVGGIILENHSRSCVQNALQSQNKEQVMEELISTIQKFLKYTE